MLFYRTKKAEGISDYLQPVGIGAVGGLGLQTLISALSPYRSGEDKDSMSEYLKKALIASLIGGAGGGAYKYLLDNPQTVPAIDNKITDIKQRLSAPMGYSSALTDPTDFELPTSGGPSAAEKYEAGLASADKVKAGPPLPPRFSEFGLAGGDEAAPSGGGGLNYKAMGIGGGAGMGTGAAAGAMFAGKGRRLRGGSVGGLAGSVLGAILGNYLGGSGNSQQPTVK